MSPMLDPKHTHTPAEQTLWDHMEAGEWAAIENLRSDAHDADLTPPDVLADKFIVDERNAHAHYQDAHEPSENQRETNGRAHCSAENEHAGGPTRMELFGLDPEEGPTGTTVHAYGSHFVGGVRVLFGGTLIPPNQTTVVSTTEITFKSPAHAAGTVDVSCRVGTFDTIALPFKVT